jgi:solute carrier family 25 iron transporter 28/37
MTQAFTRISSTEGVSRLWRGVWSVILGAGPAHAVYFGTYETVKDLAGGNREGHQFAATGASSLSLDLENAHADSLCYTQPAQVHARQ